MGTNSSGASGFTRISRFPGRKDSPEEAWIDSSDLRFSQAQISSVLRKNPLQQRAWGNAPAPTGTSYSEALKNAVEVSLSSMLEEFRAGRKSVRDGPPLRVFLFQNHFYSLDNERLWVYKQLGGEVPVCIVDPGAMKDFFRKWVALDPTEALQVKFAAVPKAIDIQPRAETGSSFRFSLKQMVLEWTIETVLNERLHWDKVKPITETFSSQSDYVTCFRWPLIEETRAQVQEGLEDIEHAPRLLAQLDEVKPKKVESRSGGSNRSFVLRPTQSEVAIRKELVYKPKPTDLVLLAKTQHERLNHFRRPGEIYAFGYMSVQEEEEEEISTVQIACDESAAVDYDKGEWWVFYVNCLATSLRIWGAQERVSELKKGLPLIDETFRRYYAGEEKRQEEKETAEEHERVKSQIQLYCQFRRLNNAQATGISDSVMALLRKESPIVRIIQGPPGTGKTSMLVSLLSVLGCINFRVQMCAPTNTAVCEVARRFAEHMLVAEDGNAQFGAFCPDCTTSGEPSQVLHVGDVVLVGNEDRMHVDDSALEDIFLPRRVDRLMKALSSNTGYRNSAVTLQQLLQSPEEDYQVHRECAVQTGTKTPSNLLQFVREKMCRAGEQFILHSHTMCQDLPTSLLPVPQRKRIHSASKLVKSMITQINAPEVTEQMVKDWFSVSRPEFKGSSSAKKEALCKGKKRFREDKDTLLHLLGSCPGYMIMGGCTPSKTGLRDACLSNARILFSTVSSAGRNCVATSGPIDCLIIDEAAQLVEAETLVATQRRELRQAILVGDHKQLPATVLSELAKRCGYGRSLFERLQGLQHPSHLLDVQYRMHPDISLFPNLEFYQGKVADGPNVLQLEHANNAHQRTMFGCSSFINVHDGREEKGPNMKSWMNPAEVEAVMHLLSKLQKVFNDTNTSASIGIISPYKAQVAELAKAAGKLEMVEIKSVDGFQGREKDIIIFSCVRANWNGQIGFLTEYRRMNVAITRARHCMWVVGNAQTLKSDRVWRSLLDSCRNRNCMIEQEQDTALHARITRLHLLSSMENWKPLSKDKRGQKGKRLQPWLGQ